MTLINLISSRFRSTDADFMDIYSDDAMFLDVSKIDIPILLRSSSVDFTIPERHSSRRDEQWQRRMEKEQEVYER